MAPEGPGPGETLDHLAGHWQIFQLRRGHRFSTDDVVIAWTATEARPGARRLLDLGAGLGSVGLLALWRLPRETRLTQIEVQAVSHGLARRTIVRNDLSHRVDARLGDLRDPGALPSPREWDLVTGSPPYIPPGKGAVSPVAQRAAARIELHGDVFDYCRAAARALAPQGVFCFAHSACDPRPERAVSEAGLVLVARRDILFREGRPPTIAVFTASHSGTRSDPPPLAIRDTRGEWSDEYRAIRKAMGAIAPN